MPLGGLLPYTGGSGGFGTLQDILNRRTGGLTGLGGSTIGSGQGAGGNKFFEKFQGIEGILGGATNIIDLMNQLREDRLSRQEKQLTRQDELFRDEYGRVMGANNQLALFGGLAGADPSALRFTPPNARAEQFATTKSPAELGPDTQEQRLLDYILGLYLKGARSGLGGSAIGSGGRR